jgi:hypothetical protein
VLITLGLLLQLSIALFLYLLVRVAVVALRKLASRLLRTAAVRSNTNGQLQPRRGFVPKISVMARGSPTRAPPLLVAI